MNNLKSSLVTTAPYAALRKYQHMTRNRSTYLHKQTKIFVAILISVELPWRTCLLVPILEQTWSLCVCRGVVAWWWWGRGGGGGDLE